MYSVCARPQSYGHRPSHPYYAGTEHVGFSPSENVFTKKAVSACTKP